MNNEDIKQFITKWDEYQRNEVHTRGYDYSPYVKAKAKEYGIPVSFFVSKFLIDQEVRS